MQKRFQIGIAVLIFVAVALYVIVALQPARLPPRISVGLLGYTNRIGPHALLGITNRSQAVITLDPQCLVRYGPQRQGSSPRRVDSIEPHKLRTIRLRPNEGFVQEVFVFPGGGKYQWQLECYVAYESIWLDLRCAGERWFQKYIRRATYPLRSDTWHKVGSELFSCPP